MTDNPSYLGNYATADRGLRSLLQASVKWSDTAMGLKNLNDDSGIAISANERLQTEVSR